MNVPLTVTLEAASREDWPAFAQNLQEAFALALEEAYGPQDGGPIPPDRELWESFEAPDAVVWHLCWQGQRVGGAVLRINAADKRNMLELFFVSPKFHNRGLGLASWQAIEAQYPDTLVWETVTPCFERRNIHFYVNKCGFHIVEFCHPGHRCAHYLAEQNQDGDLPPGEDYYFRFEKRMGEAGKRPPSK